MKSFIKIFVILFVPIYFTGCGYATRSLSPILSDIHTIYIEPFANNVDYGASRGSKNLYIPMLEVKVTNQTINQFVYDGNLKVSKEDQADVILKSELINYTRDALRYDDDDNAEEYRITIIVSLVLWDVASSEPLWVEPRFSGDATFFESGPAAQSESTAVDEAVKDLAKRIVERTVEDW
ncbi:MAG: LptE family protein [Candidatus Omnitrophica bacterium]|nr:LptE family protein [Candidatus Omnitrophota bacterium]